MTENGAVPADSQDGLEILQHAYNKADCVLDFGTTDEGHLVVQDITQHVAELEEIAEDSLNHD